ncbi:MAG: DUF2520 domain-containing protein [Bacteroidetes bacterium]|nr:DUF2520 domain-containing protein [Bacteroidota bacterium]
MRTVSILGAGGLAWNLAPAFVQGGHTVCQILSRSHTTAQQLAFLISTAQAGDAHTPLHPEADTVVLAVPDREITPAVEALLPRLKDETLLLHCAGSVPLSALAAHKGPIGVIYPVQTFSRMRRVSWKDIPVFAEGAQGAETLVTDLARSLTGGQVHEMNSDARKVVHLGAVLGSNFVNALLAQSSRVVQELGLDHTIYLPLAREVVEKLTDFSPMMAQTGPAMRGDKETVATQKALLRDVAPELIPLYELLTQVITRMREAKAAQEQA